jgi:uncharacterized membrane protein
MITRRLVVVSFILLATGIGLLAGYCNGDAGFDFSDALSGNVLKLNITTTGYPMIFGLPITLFGLLLLIATVISAVVAEIRSVLLRAREKKDSSPAESGEAAAG